MRGRGPRPRRRARPAPRAIRPASTRHRSCFVGHGEGGPRRVAAVAPIPCARRIALGERTRAAATAARRGALERAVLAQRGRDPRRRVAPRRRRRPPVLPPREREEAGGGSLHRPPRRLCRSIVRPAGSRLGDPQQRPLPAGDPTPSPRRDGSARPQHGTPPSGGAARRAGSSPRRPAVKSPARRLPPRRWPRGRLAPIAVEQEQLGAVGMGLPL